MERGERFAIALACGFGALVGSIIMLDWAGNPIMTTLGALIGGVLGYFAYRPLEVVRVLIQTLRSIDWKTVGKEVGGDFALVLGFSIALCIIGASIMTSEIYAPRLRDFFSIAEDSDMYTLIHFLHVSLVVLGGGVLFGALNEAVNSEDGSYISEDVELCFLSLVVLFSALGFIIAIATIVATGVGVVIGSLYLSYRYTVSLLKGVWWFAKTVFIGIHSNRRLMCLTDAATGSVIGYLAGNALTGLCAGAAIGLLNYELVSKRILKLVPSTK